MTSDQENPTKLKLPKKGLHDLPDVTDLKAYITEDKAIIGITGEVVESCQDPRPTGIFLRLSMTATDAMGLMNVLVAMQADYDLEVPERSIDPIGLSPEKTRH